VSAPSSVAITFCVHRTVPLPLHLYLYVNLRLHLAPLLTWSRGCVEQRRRGFRVRSNDALRSLSARGRAATFTVGLAKHYDEVRP
jgi:hypothetical protein